jgi:hypothetical protein
MSTENKPLARRPAKAEATPQDRLFQLYCICLPRYPKNFAKAKEAAQEALRVFKDG